MCCSSLRAVAQTTEHTIVQYHVRQKDTFLIENYALNGRLKSRIWHQDSIYQFDNQSFMHKKCFFHTPKIKMEQGTVDEMLQRNMYYLNEVADSICSYYPNGERAFYAFYTKNSFVHHAFYPNGTHERTYKAQWITPILYSIRDSTTDIEKKTHVSENWWNTANQTSIENDSYNGLLYAQNEYSNDVRFKNTREYGAIEPTLLQSKRWDTLGKLTYSWKPDSNHVKPFKNHQLCLYGFMDSREKVIIPPQYESVTTMKYLNSTFYIVQNQKAGVLDEWGKTVLPQQWDDLEIDNESWGASWFKCQQKGLSGIVNLKGEYILKPDYQEIRRLPKNLFLVKTHTGYGVVDMQQKVILPPKYHKLDFAFEGGYYKVTDTAQQISLIHQSGRVLIPPFLGSMFSNSRDSCFYVERAGSSQYQIFNIQKGWLWDSLDWGDSRLRGAEYTLLRRQKWGLAVGSTLLLPFEYDTLTVLRSDGLMAPFICARNKKWGVFDPSARQWTIPLKYDSLYAFVGDTVLAARLDKSWYLVNLRGERLFTDTIEAIGQLLCTNYDYNGKQLTMIFGFIKRKNHLFFYLDESFPRKISPTISCAFKRETDSIGSIYMMDDSTYKTLYINHLGFILIPENYTNIVWTGDSLLATNPAGQRILIDKWSNQRFWIDQNRLVKDYPNQNLKIFQDLNTNLYGATNSDGKRVFPFRYTAIQPAKNEPVLWAQKRVESYDSFSQAALDSLQIPDDPRPYFAGKAWRMFDTLGKLLIINGFEHPFEFHNGLGVGQTEGKYGVWNTRGQMVIPPAYDLIVRSIAKKFFYLFRRVRENEYRIGFANVAGQIIIDANLMNMSFFSGDYALVQVGDEIGLINQFGQSVIAPSQHDLRNSALNWVEKMDIFNELHDEWRWRADEDLFFSESLFDFKADFKQSLFQLDSATRTAILNLLGTFVVSDCLIFSNPRQSPFKRLYNLHNDYSEAYSHFEDLSKTTKQSQLSMPIRFEHVAIHGNRVHLTTTSWNLRQYYTYERVGTLWKQLFLKDFVDLKASNRTGLNALIQQQLEQLKFVPLDCSDPSKWINLMEHQSYIQSDGIQCFMRGNHSIKLTWAMLRLFLKAQ
jgi:hypothetical protein